MSPDLRREARRAAGAYERFWLSVVNDYLKLVGDPGVDSPLHFFVSWMVLWVAYVWPVLVLVCLFVVVS